MNLSLEKNGFFLLTLFLTNIKVLRIQIALFPKIIQQTAKPHRAVILFFLLKEAVHYGTVFFAFTPCFEHFSSSQKQEKGLAYK